MSLPLRFTCSGSYIFRSRVEENQLKLQTLRLFTLVPPPHGAVAFLFGMDCTYTVFKAFGIKYILKAKD